jgi:hypothetical protein
LTFRAWPVHYAANVFSGLDLGKAHRLAFSTAGAEAALELVHLVVSVEAELAAD